ncbi:MAG: 16S rRNA (guanine(527)-N(7))-methyltransferase RsmG [Nitrospiraceae bacterium]|nr:16S rRNA (guanine(527)-N(7))-methyltransferase RsmG [Nitrospiraceae bacterium]
MKRQNKIKALLEELLLKGGLTPTEEISRGLMAYLEELHSWNQHINLTGLKTLEDMALKHIGDTLVLLQHLPKGIHYLLDIGTGAGSPGLVLKFFCPDLNIVLVDAVRKKVSFLNTVIAKTGLTGIWAEHGRVGSTGIPRHSPPGGFDVIVSQAVGPLAELMHMALPLLSVDGLIIAMKGPNIDRELREKGLIGCKIRIIRAQVPVSGQERSLIVIQRSHVE